AYLLDILDSGFAYTVLRVADEIINQPVQHALQRLVESQSLGSLGIKLCHFAIEALEKRNASANFFQRQEVRFITVIQVGRVVGDRVGEVDQLGFERWTLAE